VAAVSSRLGIRLGVAALALGATLAAQARLPQSAPGADGAPLVPSPGSARLASLGYDALVSDFYWLRAVQLVGDDGAFSVAQAPLIGRLTAVVVGLDPWVDHPYRFAALWMSDNPKSRAEADRLLERGIAYHPRDWRDRFYLSFNRLFYEGDADAAARELAPAVGLPGAPLYLGRLLARLRAQGGDLDAAESYLRALLLHAPDEWHKVEYEKALDEIQTERRARYLDQARAVYRERTGHDIQRIQDLAGGPDAVIAELPPEPHGWEWMLDPRTGDIESSYYRHRYRLQFQDGSAHTGGGHFRRGADQRVDAGKENVRP
jgi:hypothetical protein